MDTTGEHVVPVDLGARWDPNVQDPWLIQHLDTAALVLEPYPDDPDPAPVVFLWMGCSAAVLGPPNDEAINGHRLWGSGLNRCLWAGEVVNSRWIADLERQNSVHPRHRPDDWTSLRHFVLRLKEDTFEVITRGFALARPTSDPTAFALQATRDHNR